MIDRITNHQMTNGNDLTRQATYVALEEVDGSSLPLLIWPIQAIIKDTNGESASHLRDCRPKKQCVVVRT